MVYFQELYLKKLFTVLKEVSSFIKENIFILKKTALIYNGYDNKNYSSSKRIRENFRKKHKIQLNQVVLGYAGRYAKQKNIPSLLSAFSKVNKKYKNIYLFMAGKNINQHNKELSKIIKNLDIEKK